MGDRDWDRVLPPELDRIKPPVALLDQRAAQLRDMLDDFGLTTDDIYAVAAGALIAVVRIEGQVPCPACNIRARSAWAGLAKTLAELAPDQGR